MIGVPAGTRLRIRRARRRGAGAVRRGMVTGTRYARQVPIPDPVRTRIADPLVWERDTRLVPVSALLLGGQNGSTGAEFAHATGDLTWTSTRVADGPHAALLREDAARGPLDDATLLASDYAAMARRSIEVAGHYFGARDDAGILRAARSFLRPGSVEALHAMARSAPGAPVLVTPVAGSHCFQVVDGHHRVARLAVAGVEQVEVRVRRRPVTTPLQDVLDRMSWIGGERELYQPIDAPELATSWTTVRRCTDRFEAMTAVLDELGITAGTYLDVASCYGWFLAVMADAGHDVRGIERDPLAPGLGAAVYGLDPARVATGDAVDLLRAPQEPADVVSCFSLLHHFALGRASVDAPTLARLLDRVTGRVLFLDTGQAHEAWFADSLPEWDTAYVHDFLEQHTTFDRVIDLGPDGDAVPPYADNYGRHLFACVRDPR
ncbi:methyltransferase domain-containing protein [Nocardioides sp. C4-1]|uniref:class I SAM-dependent methyltransferase n=1 Tax=Nocardioides sp. C4-1 TaxID=3151851 RepID=UPI003266294F